jgi:hypothetical protein
MDIPTFFEAVTRIAFSDIDPPAGFVGNSHPAEQSLLFDDLIHLFRTAPGYSSA